MAGIQTTILETLKQTCEWSPIPLLSNMAGLALSIYESAKVVQANKEAIRSLADSVVEISYIVIAGLQHEGRKGVQYTPKVESELRSLIGNLHSIEMYTKKHVDKRKWYSPYRGDRNAIADFRESLHCTLTNFGVKLGGEIELKILLGELVHKQKSHQDDTVKTSGGEVVPQTMYGSMLPSKWGLTIQNTAGGAAVVNYISGDHEIRTSRKRERNVNSGNSYSYLYSG
ncbi:hypothetical protein AX16_010972 [Volvariella volvacea WC 439]|nr:hypothetical protein AX16_010972 [Volvariella volvacea WC 439]